MGRPGQEFRTAFWRLRVNEVPPQPSLGNGLRQDPNIPNCKIVKINSYVRVTWGLGNNKKKSNRIWHYY